jgi:hypothetical protein
MFCSCLRCLFPRKVNNRVGFPSAQVHWMESHEANRPPSPFHLSEYEEKLRLLSSKRRTKFNIPSDSSRSPSVSFPAECPAGERAIKRINDFNEELLRQQRENLSIHFDTHPRFREPPASDKSSGSIGCSFVPGYGDSKRSKSKRSKIQHAPSPSERLKSGPGLKGGWSTQVPDWRLNIHRKRERVRPRLPNPQPRRETFKETLARIRNLLDELPERTRIEERDKRLERAIEIPPPRDIHMRRRQPLRMAGAFPMLPIRDPWYGNRQPQLPYGVSWKVGGSIPRPYEASHLSSPFQRNLSTLPVRPYRYLM